MWDGVFTCVGYLRTTCQTKSWIDGLTLQAVSPKFQEQSLGGVQFFAHAVQDGNPVNLYFWAIIKTHLITQVTLSLSGHWQER